MNKFNRILFFFCFFLSLMIWQSIVFADHHEPLPSGHIATTTACLNCHTVVPNGNTGLVSNPVPFTVDHTHVVGACDSCHLALMNTLPTHQNRFVSAECDACHNDQSWNPPVTVDHNSVRGTCRGCHEPIIPISHDYLKSETCTTCHNVFGSWLPARLNWGEVYVDSGHDTNCESCHFKHIQHTSTSNSCGACHSSTAWSPVATMDHGSTLGDCSQCHKANERNGAAYHNSPNFLETSKCNVCHFTEAWRPMIIGDIHDTARACIQCHVKVDIVNHTGVTDRCLACHFDISTGKPPQAWSPVTEMKHLETAETNCRVCHDLPAAGSASVTHQYATGQDCDACHSNTGGWGTGSFSVLPTFTTAGVMPGEFAVSNTGAATYTVPIETPPGIGGIEPNLALTYNSHNNTNGMMGVGWSLNGLPMITRCAKIEEDNNGVIIQKIGVNLGKDAYCLNGQNLVEIGDYNQGGVTGKEYRTEIDNYSRIVAVGALSDHDRGSVPSYFLVWTKDLKRLQFGSDTISSVTELTDSHYWWGYGKGENSKDDVKLLLGWNLVSVMDTHGTEMDITWEKNYPRNINYRKVDSRASLSISFLYGAMRTDAVTRYIGRAKVINDRYLQRIRIHPGTFTGDSNPIFFEYVMRYNYTGPPSFPEHDNRLHLLGITKCGYQDGYSCMPETVFTWNIPSFSFTGETGNLSLVGTSSGFDDWNQFVDLNSDGYMDVLQVTNTSVGTIALFYGDGNGNFNPRTVQFSTGTNDVIVTQSVNQTINQLSDLNEIVDVNGDGFKDIVTVDEARHSIKVWLTSVSSNDKTEFTLAPQTAENIINLAGNNFRFWNQIIDMDGDGFVDIFTAKTVEENNITKYKFHVSYGTREGKFISNGNSDLLAEFGETTYGFRQTNYLADINGDGLVDIIRRTTGTTPDRQVFVLFGRVGRTFKNNEDNKSNNQTILEIPDTAFSGFGNYITFDNQFIDINGDGQLDLISSERAVKGGLNLYTGELQTRINVGLARFGDKIQITDPEKIKINGPCGKDYNSILGYQATKEIYLGIEQPSDLMCASGENSWQSTLNWESPYVSNPGTCGQRFGTQSTDPFYGANARNFCTDHDGFEFITGSVGSSVTGYENTPYCSGDGQEYCAGSTTQLLDLGGAQFADYQGLSHYNQFADMNGDGLIDRISLDKDRNIFLELGDGYGNFINKDPLGFKAVGNEGASFRNQNRFIDVNGDGIPDYVSNGTNGSTLKIRFALASPQNRITSIVDGVGKKIRITYDTAAAKFIRKEIVPPTAPIKFATPSVYVVDKHVVSNGDENNLTSTMQFSHAYERGTTHRILGGFLYYGKTQTNHTLGASENQLFKEDFPLRGRRFYRENTQNLGSITSRHAIERIEWIEKRERPKNIKNLYHIARLSTGLQRFDPGNNGKAISEVLTSFLDTSGDGFPLDSGGQPEKIHTKTGTYWSDTQKPSNSEIIDFDSPDLLVDEEKTVDFVTNYNVPDVTYRAQLLNQSVTETLVAPGKITRTVVTNREFDALHGKLKETIRQPGDFLESIVSYEYDASGNVNKETRVGWDGTYTDDGVADQFSLAERITKYTTTYTSRISSDVPAATYVVKTNGNFPDLREKFVYDIYYGNLVRHTDVNSLDTYRSYDLWGRLSRVTEPNNTVTEIIIDNNCPVDCPPGTRLRLTTHIKNEVDPRTISTSIEYLDAHSRLLRTQNKAFNGDAIVQDRHYNNKGQLFRETLRQTLRPYGSYNYATEYHYYNSQQIKLIASPNGSVTTFDYFGTATTSIVTNTTGRFQTIYRRENGLGQLVEVIDAEDNHTTFQYDTSGAVSLITNAVGNQIIYRYDDFGNRIAADDPDLGSWQYRYNAFGEVKWQRDASSQVTHLEYDFLGRKISQEDARGISSWIYDIAKDKGLGKLYLSASPDDAAQIWTYDFLGRPFQTSYHFAGQDPSIVSYSYDPFSRLETLTYPTGLKLRHEYQNNRLRRVVDFTGDQVGKVYWQVNSMTEDDQPTDISLNGNTLVKKMAYYPETGLVDTIKTGPTNNLTGMQDLKYAYDKFTNLKSRTDLKRSLTETFFYDDLNRLLSVTGPSAKSYRYDEIGNLEYKSDVGYYYYRSSRPHAMTDIDASDLYGSSVIAGDANGDGIIDGRDVNVVMGSIAQISVAKGKVDCNSDAKVNVQDVICIYTKMSTPASRTITYDENGNVKTDGNKTITYTPFNKPSRIETDAQIITYDYDADGNRVKKSVTTGANTTNTFYVGKLYEKEVAANGAIKESNFLSVGNHVFAVLTTQNNTQTEQYLHHDHISSVESITDGNNAIVDSLSYDAHGLRRLANNWQDGLPTVSGVTQRGYTGHEMDDETGYINMNARIYDPQLGRFLSPDTIVPDFSNPQSLNRYSYVYNNPLRYTDPTGHYARDNDGFDGSGDFLGGLGSASDIAIGVDGNIGSFDVMAAHGAVGEAAGDPLLIAMAPSIARTATMTEAGVVGNGTPGFRPQGDEPSIGPYVGGDSISDPVGPVYENPGCGACDALSAWVGGAIEGARVLWTTVSEKPSILDIFIMMSENGGDVSKEFRVSPSRRAHILEGDPPGTGHGPGRGNTEGAFPDTWTDNQVIEAIERVANSPNSTWRQATGSNYQNAPITQGGPASGSPTLTSTGRPVKFTVQGNDHGVKVEVIVAPHGEGIITGYRKPKQ